MSAWLRWIKLWQHENQYGPGIILTGRVGNMRILIRPLRTEDSDGASWEIVATLEPSTSVAQPQPRRPPSERVQHVSAAARLVKRAPPFQLASGVEVPDDTELLKAMFRGDT
jgi:hypothetical protein